MIDAQLTTEISSAPRNAARKPWMSKPGTNTDVSHKQNALSTNRNNPSVTSVSGRVMSFRIGRTIALTRASTSPASRRLAQRALNKRARDVSICLPFQSRIASPCN